MRTQIDFSPLYRSAVGFDRLVSLLDSAAATSQAPGWPPYNIERLPKADEAAKDGDGDSYRIEVAVAGFRPDQLSIEVKENVLTVSGKKDPEDTSRTFLHRGLAERSFERRFQLADHIRVTEAELANGLLTIDLTIEIPEAKKPKQIAIKSASPAAPQILEAAE
ncbi:Hsp20 family protein [Asticcacaulis sp. BYS171W]|uniref:Hsp20 family protein n=1 Tax=Asticcacaulis aquaticus TaxID=2984212 RepID=A0ABT5HXC9_9CAUL|nr:Hsp20 family protein [Asticcacaulis aquaticus]MDC7684730.1 Hsp20 family protein [Asticcacaulis aquaticus]